MPYKTSKGKAESSNKLSFKSVVENTLFEQVIHDMTNILEKYEQKENRVDEETPTKYFLDACKVSYSPLSQRPLERKVVSVDGSYITEEIQPSAHSEKSGVSAHVSLGQVAISVMSLDSLDALDKDHTNRKAYKELHYSEISYPFIIPRKLGHNINSKMAFFKEMNEKGIFRAQRAAASAAIRQKLPFENSSAKTLEEYIAKLLERNLGTKPVGDLRKKGAVAISYCPSYLEELSDLRFSRGKQDDGSSYLLTWNDEKSKIEITNKSSVNHSCELLDEELNNLSVIDILQIFTDSDDRKDQEAGRLSNAIESMCFLASIESHRELPKEEQALFVLDGDLAIYGETGRKLSVAAWRELGELRQAKGTDFPLVMGIVKSGEVMDFAMAVRSEANVGDLFMVRETLKEKIGMAKKDKLSGAGSRFGQQFIYYRKKDKFPIVFSLPMPLPSNSGELFDHNYGSLPSEKREIVGVLEGSVQGHSWDEAKPQDIYPELSKAIWLIDRTRFDGLEGAILPVELAHQNCTVSLNPLGRIVTSVSQQKAIIKRD